MKSTSRSHKELENEQENTALPEFESELFRPALNHHALPANVLDVIRAHSKSTRPRTSSEQ